VLDFFTGTGYILAHHATAVERLMVGVIEDLLTRHGVDDLTDGRLISRALNAEHGINVPDKYAEDYYARYVREIRERLKR
jgi:hypothetical protein